MMKRIFVALVVLGLCWGTNVLLAHPGSGIVVDRLGNIYFVDTGSGIWKIDRQGNLTRLSGPAFHWMAIDIDDRLANQKLPAISAGNATITRVGTNPTLLLASDFPITVGRDGALCYPSLRAGEQLQILSLAASGRSTVLTTLPQNTESGPLRWLNGITASPDGSIYYTEDRAVRKLTSQGKLTTVVSAVSLTACESIPGIGEQFGPHLRGLDVDSSGTVYVAATGCGRVLKITADQTITTVLRTSSPWSPTGVAVSGSDLYILEYKHDATDDRRNWLPRVRKLSSDGRVITLATIDR